MPQEFNVVIERDADGMFVASVPSLPGCYTQAPSREELMERRRMFVASVPSLPGCYTQAPSREELMERIREAIALHLEDRGEPPETLEFVAVERVSVAA